MKLNKLLLGGALVALGATALSNNSFAADATGTASAIIRAAITLVEDTAMDFATITPDPSGDVITLTAAGAISAASGSDLAGTPSAGGFTATGTGLTAVTISFSTGDNLTGPGTDIPLGSLSHDAGGSPAFDAGGDLDFDVGGQLTIGAAQAAGTYNGTYTVTVDYQ